MTTQTQQAKTSGISFLGILAILFIGLKLTHYINWSWWWVLAPLWMPAALLTGAGLVLFILGGILEYSKHRSMKKRGVLGQKKIVSDLDRRIK